MAGTEQPSTSEAAEELKLEDLPVFRSFEDFRILDSIDTRYTVVDWTPGQKRFVWGNQCTLKNFNMTLERFQKIDMTNQSKAANDYCQEIFEQTQQQLKTVSRMKTAYPGGKPVTSRDIYKPIRTDLPIIGEPRTLVLMCMLPVDEDKQSKVAAHAEEVLRYAEVLAMIYDPETLALQYENGFSQSFYGALTEKSERSMNDVFSTCIWQTEEVKEDLIRQVKALTLNSDKIDVECKKQSAKKDETDEDRWHRLIFIPVIDPAKGSFSILVTEYDVSELKKVQHDLVETNVAQEEFFAAISHELRTPLNGIIGLSSSLIDDPSLTPQMAKTLKIIKSSGMRLGGLVNDILDAASSKRDTLVIRHEQVALSEVAATVCDCLEVLVRRGVKIVNQVPDGLPVVQGDNGRIQQILTNLVSNSIKFTEKGSITLGGKVAEDGFVHMWCKDTGIGIPADKLETVWGAFKQVDKATTRKYGGTGLGLSLVRKLVEVHGGRVWIESCCQGDERGSTFFFSLPVVQPPVALTPLSAAAVALAPSRADSAQSVHEGAGHGGLAQVDKRPATLAAAVASPKREEKACAPDTAPPSARDVGALGGSLRGAGVMQGGSFRGGRKEESTSPGAAGSSVRRGSQTLLPPPVEGVQAAIDTECRRCRDLELRCLDLERRCAELEAAAQALERRDRRPSQSTHSESSAPFVGEFNFRPSDEDRGKGRLILSVDDDMVNIAVLRSMLEPMGFKVDTRSSGAAALQYLDTCDALPDVILLDNMMPIMSGIEVVSKIRQRFSWTQLPIIMVSAKSNTDSIIEGLETGANDYVCKPFNRNELLARITKAGDIKEAIQESVDARHRALLKSVLPVHVLDTLPGLPCSRVDQHEAVTLMHCSVADFDAACAHAAPADLIEALNRMIQTVESLCDKYQCFKVDVSCSACLIVVGHEGRWGRPDHPDCLLHLALELLSTLGSIALPGDDAGSLQLQVVVHHGKVASGVVGVHTPQYCLFGETARTARALRRFGQRGNIVVSKHAADALGRKWPLVPAGSAGEGEGAVQLLLVQAEQCDWQRAQEEMLQRSARGPRDAERGPPREEAQEALRGAARKSEEGGGAQRSAGPKDPTPETAGGSVGGAAAMKGSNGHQTQLNGHTVHGEDGRVSDSKFMNTPSAVAERPPTAPPSAAQHHVRRDDSLPQHLIPPALAAPLPAQRADSPYQELWICSLLQEMPCHAGDRQALSVMQDLAYLRLLRTGHITPPPLDPHPAYPPPWADRAPSAPWGREGPGPRDGGARGGERCYGGWEAAGAYRGPHDAGAEERYARSDRGGWERGGWGDSRAGPSGGLAGEGRRHAGDRDARSGAPPRSWEGRPGPPSGDESLGWDGRGGGGGWGAGRGWLADSHLERGAGWRG